MLTLGGRGDRGPCSPAHGPARPEPSPEPPRITWRPSLLWTPEKWGSPFSDLAHPPWVNAKAPCTRGGGGGQVPAGNQGWYGPPECPVCVHPGALRPSPPSSRQAGKRRPWAGFPGCALPLPSQASPAGPHNSSTRGSGCAPAPTCPAAWRAPRLGRRGRRGRQGAPWRGGSGGGSGGSKAQAP